jgi:hypothetical protein
MVLYFYFRICRGGSQTVDNFHTVIGSFVGRDPNVDWLSPRILGQRALLRANGCYEKRWFEASSVMILKLAENLIIERHKKDAEIKNKDGDYLMLSGLVNAL